MHPLQQQIDELRKYHEALGTKLASLERHLEAGQAPTMDRQNYTVSSDGSVMHEGKRYSFKYSGAAIENVLILKAYPLIIQHADGVFYTEAITNVREVKEPAKEWEIVEFKCIGKWDGKKNIMFVRDECGSFGLVDGFRFTEDHILNGAFGSVKDGRWAIHAVRRLRDDTTWRVGDRFNQGVIDAFELFIDGNMWVCGQGLRLKITSDELKRPEPLFTTADGVQVPAQSVVYFWYPEREMGESIAVHGLNWANHYSTREAAQSAYDKWLFEQPVLTLRDLEFRGISGHQWGILKQFVKDKISKK